MAATKATAVVVLRLVNLCSLFSGEVGATSPEGEPLGYVLGTGDRVRVTVFGEPDLSGEFEIDATGKVSLPLVGDIRIGGQQLRQAEQSVADRLAQGYLANPRVNIEVLNYRPFYIIGEVTAVN